MKWNANMDEAPRDGTEVDLWIKSERGCRCYVGIHFDIENSVWVDNYGWRITDYYCNLVPTHWMTVTPPQNSDMSLFDGVIAKVIELCLET